MNLLGRRPRISDAHKERFKDESLCTNCGACCHLSFELGEETVVVEELPCRYLRYNEKGESYCTTYETRLEKGFCYKVSARSVRWGLFPYDCPYVEGIPGYKGKISLKDHPELLEPLIAEYKDTERPEFIRAKDWHAFFNRPGTRPLGRKPANDEPAPKTKSKAKKAK